MNEISSVLWLFPEPGIQDGDFHLAVGEDDVASQKSKSDLIQAADRMAIPLWGRLLIRKLWWAGGIIATGFIGNFLDVLISELASATTCFTIPIVRFGSSRYCERDIIHVDGHSSPAPIMGLDKDVQRGRRDVRRVGGHQRPVDVELDLGRFCHDLVGVIGPT